MLYQVATGLLSADEIAAPIRSIFRRQKNVEVFMDEVVGVDPQRRFVQTADRSVHYDYLVLATGIHYNYFGHNEWKKFAPGLDSVDDADRIRGRILTAFEAAEHKAAESGAKHTEIAKLLTFVLVGGGTAGVELAGTIAEIARMALTGDFRHINPAKRILSCSKRRLESCRLIRKSSPIGRVCTCARSESMSGPTQKSKASTPPESSSMASAFGVRRYCGAPASLRRPRGSGSEQRRTGPGA